MTMKPTTRKPTIRRTPLRSRRGFLGLAAASAAGLLAACSSTAGPPAADAQESDAPILPEPRSVTVALSASSDVNPGPTGQAAPISLRLYTLRSVGRFQTLDFFELSDGALGGAVVDSRTISLKPGESRSITLNAGVDGAYLGVAGAFRDIDGARWRGQTSLTGRESFSVRASRAAIAVRGS